MRVITKMMQSLHGRYWTAIELSMHQTLIFLNFNKKKTLKTVIIYNKH